MSVRGIKLSGRRLMLLVVLTSLSSLATGAVLYTRATERIVAAEQEKLSALMEVRRNELTEYLESIREEIRFWAKNRIMRAALVEFSAAWKKLGGNPEATLQRLYIADNPHPLGEKDNLEFARDGSEYSDVHERYHYWLRSFLLHRGVYDVFLFDPEGNLVYTSFKELDYATNLVSGKWKDTDLGRAFRSARDNPFPSFVAFFDFAPYEPSYGAPASFISAPVLDDAGGFLGVLAFQFPSDRINRIMQFTAGMGETGETYVVGEDLLMRSDSRFSEQPTTLKTRVDTVTARLALEGKTGFDVTPDYRGISVFSAYGPVQFENVTWAVMAEMDESEVMAPALELRQLLLGAGLGIGVVVLYVRATERIVAAGQDKLSALMEVRRSELTEYLESIREEIRFWAKNRIMRAALVEFSAAWKKLSGNPETTLQKLYIVDNPYPLGEKDNLEFARDGSEYSDVHVRYHYWLRSFLLHRGIYDVFLFDPEGNLVYTSFKELDYATNLVSGKWKDTDLGRAFRSARDNLFPSFVAFFDFAPYGPSHSAPASFISAPVLDDAGGFLGVLAFQYPSDRINRIMQFTAGMGETGETYVVGQDLLMRSDSRFSEQPTTLKTRVDTVTARLALEGKTGFDVTPDYRGISVFSAYGPVQFENVTWAVMAEMDESEVMAPALELRQLMLGAGLGIGVAVGLLAALLASSGRW